MRLFTNIKRHILIVLAPQLWFRLTMWSLSNHHLVTSLDGTVSVSRIILGCALFQKEKT